MLFLTEQDVKEALAGGDAYKEAVDVIEQVFRQQSDGTTYHLKRYTMTHPAHPGHLWHNIRIIPGMVPELGAAAVRVYSGYRGTNRSEVICLFDWADMRMSAIISDFHLHAIRTSAPYGVAAKYLARADAGTLGIIGTGRYARGMAQAVCAVRPIETLQVYSRDPANVRSFCAAMSATLGIDVVPCRSGRDAARGADIVITATSGNTVVFEADWLEPGMLLMSLAPGEFDAATVLRCRVYLSAIEQVLGDDPPRKPFDGLVAAGRFGVEDVAADLYDVVAGKRPGRTAADQIILYECAGLGLLDAGIGHWIYQRAKSLGLGTEMPFGEEQT
ncbi:MAG TPA: ornithine cyclodeaminase family protein [Xanthobacteraceae bacterium]|jgi:ornithine cyclodeaminase/alanine dehydrogenase-like protein (mu-crystallin family)|nr:ornithine cyclodeaminase family protein [Xanthobacteraceae bacterium]